MRMGHLGVFGRAAPGLQHLSGSTCVTLHLQARRAHSYHQRKPRWRGWVARASKPDALSTDETTLGKVMSKQANYVKVRLDPGAAEAALTRWRASNNGHPVPPMQVGEYSGAAKGLAVPPGSAGPGEGLVELLCVVRGLLKKMRQSVVVGDRVRVGGIEWVEGRGVVEEVLERRNELADPAVANIDQVLVMFALARPALDWQAATRFLVGAEAAAIPAAVLLNKVDLVPHTEAAAAVAQVESWGYAAIPVSAHSGSGLGAAAAALAGRTSVVVGPSGVGKSSLINALKLREAAARNGNGVAGPAAERQERDAADMATSVAAGRAPAACQDGADGKALEPSTSYGATAVAGLDLQAVGNVSGIGRGRHTTRHVSLLEVGGGLLADSPGFNQPALDGLAAEDLASCFPEVRAALGSCAFSDCQHLAEPGCALRVGWGRHAWYAELFAELRAAQDLARSRAASKTRRQGSLRFKSRAGGRQAAEVLLDPKSHRRIGRNVQRQGMQDSLFDAAADEEDLA